MFSNDEEGVRRIAYVALAASSLGFFLVGFMVDLPLIVGVGAVTAVVGLGLLARSMRREG